MNELALFAGAGGGILGGKLLGWRTVCAVEWEPYCQAVLLARQADKILDRFPIWDDIRTFDGTSWAGKVNVITAGFPCQPFSQAGKEKGESDERNMWPDTIRIIREVGPEWCLLENVPNLLTFEYIRQIFGELAEAGYDAEWGVFSAADAGAPHLRKRLWILAHSKANPLRRNGQQDEVNSTERGLDALSEPSGFRDVANSISSGPRGSCGKGDRGDADQEQYYRDQVRDDFRNSGEVMANTDSSDGHGRSCSLQMGRKPSEGKDETDDNSRRNQWSPEPAVGRVAHGVAHRVDRLKALGNGQVPHTAVLAWQTLRARMGI